MGVVEGYDKKMVHVVQLSKMVFNMAVTIQTVLIILIHINSMSHTYHNQQYNQENILKYSVAIS